MGIKFSLVSTVFNEYSRIYNTINDFESQTVLPDEIIITDAGSTDGTYEILNDWKNKSKLNIVILQKQFCNVAEGRNLAIRNVRNEVIVSTDFGCRFDKEWLKDIIAPFIDDTIDVVGGAFTVDENEQRTVISRAAFILNNSYKINVYSDHFLPSSRSIAFKKNVFNKIGGYCEWLTLAADDFVFGLEIKAHNFKMVFASTPRVFWIRHQNLRSFLKEARRYGLGEGEAIVNKAFFCKSLFMAVLTFFFFLFLLINLIYYSKVSIILFFISSISIYPYFKFLIRWYRKKSNAYNYNVLFSGFNLIFWQKLYYLSGYLKGYFFSSKEQKGEAKLLHRRLKNKI